MTNQKHRQLLPEMGTRIGLFTTLAFGVTMGTLFSGCGEEPPPPAPVVKRAPAPPPPPKVVVPQVTSISDLMAQYNIDDRVNLQEADAPATDEQRIAVLLFFDAFARGDAASVGELLSAPDQIQLERMTKSDEWAKVTDDIFGIDVCAGTSPTGDTVVLGVFMVGDSFQPTLWTYEVTGDPSNGGATFDAEPTPPNVINLLSGTMQQWIQEWYAILGKELARAQEMDEEIEIPTQDFTEEEESAGGNPGGPGGGPGGGGGAPGKRKRDPSKPKVDPNPGFGPGGN